MKTHFAIGVTLCAAVAAVASASTGRPVDVTTRARGAERVLVAVVADVQPRFDVNEFGDRLIISRVFIQVEETLKGGGDQFVAVDKEGGTIGDLTLQVSDMPGLASGDKAVFFLTRGQAGIAQLHRRGLGVAKLDRNGFAADLGMHLAEIRAAVKASQAGSR